MPPQDVSSGVFGESQMVVETSDLRTEGDQPAQKKAPCGNALAAKASLPMSESSSLLVVFCDRASVLVPLEFLPVLLLGALFA